MDYKSHTQNARAKLIHHVVVLLVKVHKIARCLPSD